MKQGSRRKTPLSNPPFLCTFQSMQLKNTWNHLIGSVVEAWNSLYLFLGFQWVIICLPLNGVSGIWGFWSRYIMLSCFWMLETVPSDFPKLSNSITKSLKISLKIVILTHFRANVWRSIKYEDATHLFIKIINYFLKLFFKTIKMFGCYS